MIRITPVMVVDENGEQLGVLQTAEALRIAEERGLDLVEVAPNGRPPVCKIMDYGKFKYEQSKKARKARQASHTVKVKTIQFRPKTDDHDYEFKREHVRRFLEEGNKVKVSVFFRGREITHTELGERLLERIVAALRLPVQCRDGSVAFDTPTPMSVMFTYMLMDSPSAGSSGTTDTGPMYGPCVSTTCIRKVDELWR